MTISMYFGAASRDELDVTYTATSTATGFDATDLAKWPRRPWRGDSTALHDALITGTMTSRQVGAASLVWPQASQTARARLRLGTGGGATMPAREQLDVDWYDNVNSSGTYAVVGAADHLSAVNQSCASPTLTSYIEGGDDAETVLVFTYANPAANPGGGLEAQAFRAVIEAPAGGDVTVNYMKMYEQGIERATATLDVATVSAGERIVVHGYWDADDLATDEDGQYVKIHLSLQDGTPTDGDWRVYAVDWYALPTGGTYEGDWVRVFPASMIGESHAGSDLATADFRWGCDLRVLSAGAPTHQAAARLGVELRDHANTDGYVEVGLVAIGRSLWWDDTSRHEGAQRPFAVRVESNGDMPVRVLTVPTWAGPELMTLLAKELHGSQPDPRFMAHFGPDTAAASTELLHLPFWATLGPVAGTQLLSAETLRSVPLEIREVVE